MDRLAASLLLNVAAINLAVSAVTHLMPLLGGRHLNPLPAWAGEATFLWELAAACLALFFGLLIKPNEDSAPFREHRHRRPRDPAG